MTVTPLYAGLLALLYLFLTFRVIRFRRGNRVDMGDGGHALLQRYVRAHANFAEYAPFALLLIAFVELGAAPQLLVHALASLLVLGRLSHAWGVSQLKEDYRFRVAGMAMTFTSILLAAAWLLYHAVFMPLA